MREDESAIVVAKAGKDVREAASTLSDREARYLVDSYYTAQKARIVAGNQVRVMGKDEEPHAAVQWLGEQNDAVESALKSLLKPYVESHRHGRWLLAQHGIGPVLAAGILAHVDVRIATTAGKLWRFAGLDPTVKWEKGKKRPWNASLKTLCWKIGESFKKSSGGEASFYGKLYKQRKVLEVERNAAGLFKDQAAAKLENFKIQDPPTRAKYEAGLLPDGRLDLRAMRWAVKMFLSHYQEVAYECVMGEKPPKPWIISIKNHVDYVPPPLWPIE